jgi:hypothetical protein
MVDLDFLSGDPPDTALPDSLSELIRVYQSKASQSSLREATFGADSTSSVYEFQKVLRQLALFYTSVSQSNTPEFFSFLLSGVPFAMDNHSLRSSCLSDFVSPNFIFSMPNLFNFLRTNAQIFSLIVFSAIEERRIDHQFISFSTIPALFQNGWCIEESDLWSEFLSHYLTHISAYCDYVGPTSPHLAPFRAFFIQKLILDYLPLSVSSDLGKFLFHPEARRARVQFTFDAAKLLHRDYIRIINSTARGIMSKLRLHLARVPLSVRRLLTNISNSPFKFGSCAKSGLEKASFFFVNCALIPVIREPILLGIDVDPVFLLDDLADMFFYFNFLDVLLPQ